MAQVTAAKWRDNPMTNTDADPKRGRFHYSYLFEGLLALVTFGILAVIPFGGDSCRRSSSSSSLVSSVTANDNIVTAR